MNGWMIIDGKMNGWISGLMDGLMIDVTMNE